MPVLINPNSALPLATGWKCRLSCSSFSLKLTGHCSQGGPALTWPEPRHAFKCCCTPQGVSAPVQSAPRDTLHPSSALHICRRHLTLSYVSLHEKRRELWSSKECLSLLNIHSLSSLSLSLSGKNLEDAKDSTSGRARSPTLSARTALGSSSQLKH